MFDFKMYYEMIGDRTAQLKRDVTVPNARVVVVKFIKVSTEDILYRSSFVS